MKAIYLKKELEEQANPKKAEILQQYFKTKKGEYGYNDVFFGISVPEQRKIAKKYKNLPLFEVNKLLKDKIHECRLCALIILIEKYRKGDQKIKNDIVKIYLNNLNYINNWDLVDISAPHILGIFFLENTKNRNILKKMIKSNNLWEKRIAIISTLSFIKNNQIKPTLQIAKIFIKDDNDLIHKATGWMLREVGKKDKKVLIQFLNLYGDKMPRIMLRYAIEKLTEKQRKKYLKK